MTVPQSLSDQKLSYLFSYDRPPVAHYHLTQEQVPSLRQIDPSKIGGSFSGTMPPLRLSSTASFTEAICSSSKEKPTASRKPLPGYPKPSKKIRMKKEKIWIFPLKISILTLLCCRGILTRPQVGYFEVASGAIGPQAGNGLSYIAGNRVGGFPVWKTSSLM